MTIRAQSEASLIKMSKMASLKHNVHLSPWYLINHLTHLTQQKRGKLYTAKSCFKLFFHFFLSLNFILHNVLIIF